MGKGLLLRAVENSILRIHLRGKGIEIGALWRRFPIGSQARAWYVDHLHPQALAGQYPELAGRITPVDLVADAANLPFTPGTLDFIVASHVLEHLMFPLASLQRWYDLLAPGGTLLLKVPDKRFTFDRQRLRTSLEHLISEHNNPSSFDREAHYADWVQFVGGVEPSHPEFNAQVARLMHQDYSIHFHVWTSEDLLDIVEFTQSVWSFEWKTVLAWRARFFRKEVTLVLQKNSY